jgi:hypothetical protein
MIPTDHKQAHREMLGMLPTPRHEIGLPEDAIVFACSNQLFKITPDLWATWCRILKRVPNSVLWLQRSPAAAESRLRKAFERQGLDQRRLIFTDRCPKHEYMRRQGAADVFLDTPIYNAYTTGADNLWSGTPIVTMPLERMASRAAASLCHAVGVPEMVVQSYQEYEERAVELGMDREKRLILRRRIEEARLTCPLYDTPGWTRQFERMLLHMWAHHAAGKEPQTFRVRDAPELPSRIVPKVAAIGTIAHAAPAAKFTMVNGAPLSSPKATSPRFPYQDQLVLPGRTAAPAGVPPCAVKQASSAIKAPLRRPPPPHATQMCRAPQIQAAYGIPSGVGPSCGLPRPMLSPQSSVRSPMVSMQAMGLRPGIV